MKIKTGTQPLKMPTSIEAYGELHTERRDPTMGERIKSAWRIMAPQIGLALSIALFVMAGSL